MATTPETNEPTTKKESFMDKLKKTAASIKGTLSEAASNENLEKIKQTVKKQADSVSATVSQNVNKFSDKIKETAQKTTSTDKNQNDDNNRNAPKR